MKIYVPFDFPEDPARIVRRAGYGELTDYRTGQKNYVRRLSNGFYPRFHVYIEQDRENRTSLNLHLDQKKPSYQGAHAHNAEYDSEVVVAEGKRIAGVMKNLIDNHNQTANKPEAKPGFWSRLFNKNEYD